MESACAPEAASALAADMGSVDRLPRMCAGNDLPASGGGLPAVDVLPVLAGCNVRFRAALLADGCMPWTSSAPIVCPEAWRRSWILCRPLRQADARKQRKRPLRTGKGLVLWLFVLRRVRGISDDVGRLTLQIIADRIQSTRADPFIRVQSHIYECLIAYYFVPGQMIDAFPVLFHVR